MKVTTRPTDRVLYGDDMNSSYRYNLERKMKRMAELVKEGHEIKWSDNKNWCEINGKSFNVPKRAWILRKHEFLNA